MSLKYRVTVDGTSYTVEVEELGAGAPLAVAPVISAPAPAAPVVSAPVVPAPAAPAPAEPTAPAAAAPVPVAAGTYTIDSPMPGKILDVKVAVGDSVNSGDLVVMLEAMKMENEIVAAVSGKVTQIRVKSGDSVNTGDVMIVLG